jgi:hypothetical protein
MSPLVYKSNSDMTKLLQHPLLGSEELYVTDYILAALEGLDSEYYVPGSYPCGNNTKYF